MTESSLLASTYKAGSQAEACGARCCRSDMCDRLSHMLGGAASLLRLTLAIGPEAEVAVADGSQVPFTPKFSGSSIRGHKRP